MEDVQIISGAIAELVVNNTVQITIILDAQTFYERGIVYLDGVEVGRFDLLSMPGSPKKNFEVPLSYISMEVRGLGKIIYAYLALFLGLEKRRLTAEADDHSDDAEHLWRSLHKRHLAVRENNLWKFVDVGSLLTREEIIDLLNMLPVRIGAD